MSASYLDPIKTIYAHATSTSLLCDIQSEHLYHYKLATRYSALKLPSRYASATYHTTSLLDEVRKSLTQVVPPPLQLLEPYPRSVPDIAQGARVLIAPHARSVMDIA
eukprot:143239-Rhodomonas_salina.1